MVGDSKIVVSPTRISSSTVIELNVPRWSENERISAIALSVCAASFAAVSAAADCAMETPTSRIMLARLFVIVVAFD
jgi:hypothetical protein